MQSFEATILYDAKTGGAWIEVPFDVKAQFGSARPKVKALFDGKVEYRGSLVRMQGGSHVLGVRKDIREVLDKNPGDRIEVQLALDTAPRAVDIPAELQAFLEQSPKANSYYLGLSYTHQKEYAQYVGEAKKEETRLRRAKKTIEMLEEQSVRK